MKFDLLDGSGARVGTAFDNIADLKPGETWKFKALVLEDSATTAKFSEATGY